MEFVKVKTLTDIKKGDTLMISGRKFSDAIIKVISVKVSVNDGTEIIVGKPNEYFNLGMYLEGNSWVKNVRVLRNKDENSPVSKETIAFAQEYALWIISAGQKYINMLSATYTDECPMDIFIKNYYGKGWVSNMAKVKPIETK